MNHPIAEILKKHKTVAVYGATGDPLKPSHYVPEYVQSRGYTIIPINPREEKILEQKVYRNILDIPESIGILNVFRRSEKIMELMPEVLERRKQKGDIAVMWLQSGIISFEAKKMAEEAGIVFIQDLCLMVEVRKLGH
jgi:predicted CoA-binding protein